MCKKCVKGLFCFWRICTFTSLRTAFDPQQPLYCFAYSSALVFSSVCSFYGTIGWAPARFLETGGSQDCRWLEIQPEISVGLMNYYLHLTPTSHQALNTIWVPQPKKPRQGPIVWSLVSRSSAKADGNAIDWCESNVIRNCALYWKKYSELVRVWCRREYKLAMCAWANFKVL